MNSSAKLWKFEVGDWVLSKPVWPATKFVGRIVGVGTLDGVMGYLVDAADGRCWHRQPEDLSPAWRPHKGWFS